MMMIPYRDALYVGTENPYTGAEVWRYDGDRWTQVNEAGFGAGQGTATAPVVFDGRLIVAGNGGASGARLYAMEEPDPTDGDADGVADLVDDCPDRFDPAQEDADGDGVGDLCEDGDGDGVPAPLDCNDRDGSIHPGASDPFEDGLDRDCDGKDEGAWEWDDDGIDSNGNGLDNCGTVPIHDPGAAAFSLVFPWLFL